MNKVQRGEIIKAKETLEVLRNSGISIEDLINALDVALENEFAKTDSADVKEKSTEQQVADLLIQIGVPAHLKGYKYIRCAVGLIVEDHNYLDGGVTKMLYPEVAKRFSTTASRVERGIRHAIEVAWNRADFDVIQDLFGYTVNPLKGKPTNSEFIAMLADIITR